MATVQEFSKTFMEQHVAIKNKPSEQKSKRYILDKHILPVVGSLPMGKVGKAPIDEITANLIKAGRSRKTASNVLAVLSKLLGYAVDVEALEKKPKMGLFKIMSQPYRFLEFDELEALLKAAEPEPEWHLAVLLGCAPGL